jgi:hypothetical protein
LVDARSQRLDRGGELLADADLGRCRDAGEPDGDAVQRWAWQPLGGVLELGVELM